MNGGNRGQIRVIEAVLAVIVIFASFTLSTNLTVSQNKAQSEDLAADGLHALMKLDSDGSLSRYIADKNWTSLREAVNLALPTGISFNLTIFDEQMRQVNDDVVSNGGFGSQTVCAVEYACASRDLVFHCYIIHLELAVTA
ncbi:MAG TPA: hypothetical protein VMT26_04895 [Candidatus Bathyarchaeia archaeon]|jgi:hypothetical protein|nr:hypothetical protein [Candidatus Bathyarchaeia archaeon]